MYMLWGHVLCKSEGCRAMFRVLKYQRSFLAVAAQGLDLAEDRLLYACAGLAIDPASAAATAAAVDGAADPQVIAADIPVAAAAIVPAADGQLGHHHHHRRQLLQTGPEWESAWLVSSSTYCIESQQCALLGFGTRGWGVHMHVSTQLMSANPANPTVLSAASSSTTCFLASSTCMFGSSYIATATAVAVY